MVDIPNLENQIINDLESAYFFSYDEYEAKSSQFTLSSSNKGVLINYEGPGGKVIIPIKIDGEQIIQVKRG